MLSKLLIRIQNASLKWRLTVWYVFLLAFTLAAFSAFIYISLSDSLHRELDTALFSQGVQMINNLDDQKGERRLDPDLPLSPGTYFSLFDAKGKLLETNMPKSLISSLPVSNLQSNRPRTVRADGVEWRVLLVASQGKYPARLELARSREETEGPLDRLLLLMVVALPLTLLVAGGGGLLLAERALRPIDRIAAKARRISATDLSSRLELPHGNDEVGHLVATLDEMLGRLEGAFQRQRRFTADASHELRTPLTVIRSQAEAALNRKHSPDEYRSSLAVICDQTQKLINLVNRLLVLSRSDNGQEQLTIEQLDLTELVGDVAEEFKEQATDKGLQLVTILPEKIMINGDQTWITHLLTNLVDNALKYTAAGQVEIGLRKNGRQALLWVKDTGSGIPKEDLNHIFERFYRVDKARSRSGGSFGLGLSICQWVVNAHGGKIEVNSKLGRGTTFKVWLPLLK